MHLHADVQRQLLEWVGGLLDVCALGHCVGVSWVVERPVHEHTDVVDHRDGLVDDGMASAEELQAEGIELDGVAGSDDCDVVPRGGPRDSCRSEDRHTTGRLEQAVEVRSETSRVGKGCVRQCRYRWSPYN